MVGKKKRKKLEAMKKKATNQAEKMGTKCF